MIDLLWAIAVETVRTFLLAAPYVLLGLGIAGFIHVLMPGRLIQRWMGQPGMSGVIRAALIGVPLPLCSCGVVPVTVEMRRKGASQPASVSFLTTTPESGVDSILLTWGLMGPVMAIARPISAVITAIVGGIGSIAYLDDNETPDDKAQASAACHHDHGHDHDHGHHHHGHDHHHHHHHHGHDHHDHDHGVGESAAKDAWRALVAWVRMPEKGEDDPIDEAPKLGDVLVKPAFRYGFAELLDDLGFWLVIGIVTAGVLTALVPDNLAEYGLGAGIWPMLLMLVAGVPVYMCASASTPVAAALMAKGLSPGAALVFLLSGPATNAATIVLLLRIFGRRFVQVYLASVVIGSLICGLLLEALVLGVGWDLVMPSTSDHNMFGPITWGSAIILAGLLVWRFSKGAWGQGMAELRAGFAETPWPKIPTRRLVTVLAVLVVIGWLLSGFTVVPAGSSGYAFNFDRLVEADLEPGLHWSLPAPFGRIETRQSGYSRRTDIGFDTDLDSFANRRELSRFADPDAWHSTVAAMNTDIEQATFLTADERLVEVNFTVHYGLSDAKAFFYELDHSVDVVALYAESVARRFLAGEALEDLLTTRRAEIEEAIHQALQARLDAMSVGIAVTSIHVVDIHPPGEAVFAFRDVSSAREEKETRIHLAHERKNESVPRARGERASRVAEANATAVRERERATGEADSFVARADAWASAPSILRHLLWIETAERVLADRPLVIVPPGSSPQGVTLWRQAPRQPPPPAVMPHFPMDDP
ncbi:MAG: SO_0444 family Cu/Zn efflux transporter [Acidobacteriota bacterium]